MVVGTALDTDEGIAGEMAIFGKLEIPRAEASALSNALIVELLVETGVSRLSAERIVEVERTASEPGRARRHRLGYR